MNPPRIQVEFFGNDIAGIKSWILSLESLGASVNLHDHAHPDSLENLTDVAMFSGADQFFKSEEFLKLCDGLKSNGIFVVGIYQNSEEINEINFYQTQPNWLLPLQCGDHERLSYLREIINTVRFLKQSSRLQSLQTIKI